MQSLSALLIFTNEAKSLSGSALTNAPQTSHLPLVSMVLAEYQLMFPLALNNWICVPVLFIVLLRKTYEHAILFIFKKLLF